MEDSVFDGSDIGVSEESMFTIMSSSVAHFFVSDIIFGRIHDS